MKIERPTKEQLKEAADKKVIELLRQYYSEIPTLANLPDYDIRNLDEYPTFMSIFLDGCTFGIDCVRVVK